MSDGIDIESIGVAFDTSGLEKGTAALKANLDAANAAANAADRASSSGGKLASSYSGLAQKSEAAADATERHAFAQQVLAQRELAAADAADKYMTRLQAMASVAGKTRAEVLALEAAHHGVSDGAAEYIKRIEDAATSTHKLSLANSQVTRELSVMAGEMVRGNWTRLEGSMTVLANRTGATQVALQALTSPLGIVTAGVLALGAAVLAGGIYYEHHAQQLAALEAQLAATGRTSTFTKGELDSMIRSLDALPDVSREMAVGVIAAFAKQHDIARPLMQQLIGDVDDFAAATGTKVPEAAKQLAQAFDSPAEGAKTLHKELGILSEAEVMQIEHMVQMGQVAQAQELLLKALHERIDGLGKQAMGPLGQATRELKEEWLKLNDAAGHSSWTEVANAALVGMVNSVTWLVAHVPDTFREWDKAAIEFAKNHPWLIALMPGGNIPGLLATQGSPSAGSAGGGSRTPGVPSAEDVDTTKQWLDAVTKANAQYKPQAQAITELRERQDTLNSALDVAVQKYGDESVQAKRLRIELTGVNEALANSASARDPVSAAIERLKQASAAASAQSKVDIAHMQSEQRQGLLGTVQAIEMETDAQLNAIDVQRVYAEQELALLGKKKNSQQEQARVQGQIATLDQQYADVQAASADKVDEAYSKMFANSFKGYAQQLDQQDRLTDALEAKAKAIDQEVSGNQSLTQSENALALAMLYTLQARRANLGLQGDEYDATQREIAAREHLANSLNSQVMKRANDKAATEAERAWQHTYDEVGRDLENAILDHGSAGFKKLFQDAERWAAHLVLQPILAPVQAGIASMLNPTAASAANAGSMGLNFGGIGGALGFGGGATGAGALSVGTASAADISLMYAGTEGIAAPTIMSTIGAGLAAITPMGWLAIGAMAVSSLFGGGHGPKTESGFGSGVTVTGDPSQAQGIMQSIQGMYSSVGSAVGLSNTTLSGLGAFVSTDPNGTAMTQLQVTGGSYNRGSLLGGTENVGRSDADLTQAVSLASAQLVLKNLQDAVKGPIGDYLRSVDIASASLDDLQKALQVAQDVGNFDKMLTALGPAFANLASWSVTAKDALIADAGGLQNVQAQFGSFLTDFYSQGEQQNFLWKSLVQTFTQANVVLPSTHDAFRAAVEAAEAAGDEHTLSVLMASEAAFNKLYPAIDATAASADAAANQLTDWQKAYFDSWTKVNDSAQQAAQATQSMWGDIFHSLQDKFAQLFKQLDDEVAALRGDRLNSPTGITLAGAQANLADLVAQVNSGGKGAFEAAQQLPMAAELLRKVAATSGLDAFAEQLVEARAAQAIENVRPALGVLQQRDLRSAAAAMNGASYTSSLSFAEELRRMTSQLAGIDARLRESNRNTRSVDASLSGRQKTAMRVKVV